ncbi:MAG: type II secretion system protein [Clostridia bacterium]|nr:type II secretion system protein [Clostridia bacterium]
MKNIRGKKESGITLIALIVTIIVLLILAGISIRIAMGSNGIIEKTKDAKNISERTSLIETAKMDILEKQAENHGSLSEDELVEILTSDKYNTRGTLSDNQEESVLQKTLTVRNGKYKILVSEIYNGELATSGGTLSLDELKTKISKQTSDCMIDEYGNIIPINVWSYEIIDADNCEICCSEEGMYGNEYYSAYKGNFLEDGSLEYNIPTFIKIEGKSYKVTCLGPNFLSGRNG